MTEDFSNEIEKDENLNPDDFTPEDGNENPEGDEPGKQDAEPGEPTLGTEEDVYEANLTYKVLDEEKSMPEYVKAIMNKENESEIRDIFERADGIHHVKEKLTKQREDYTNLENTYKQTTEQLTQFNNFHQALHYHKENGNVGEMLKLVGLSQEDLMKEAVRVYEYGQMSEQDRAAYDQRSRAVNENAQLHQRLNDFEAREAQRTYQEHQTQMAQELTSGEHASLITRYDSAVGEGKFQQLVNDIGKSHYISTAQASPDGIGQSLSVKQAVEIAINRLGLKSLYGEPAPGSQTREQLTTQQQTPAAPIQQPEVEKPKPIPSLGNGTGQAPIRRKYKTMAEMKKAMNEELANMD